MNGSTQQLPIDARYHVPRSQVWEGSGGRQAGCVHLHATESIEFGRIVRVKGQALCGKSHGWYERDPEGERLCPRCETMRDRLADIIFSVCPNCGGYVEELDGFGVIAHDRCGYCTHFDIAGDTCRVCGSTDV